VEHHVQPALSVHDILHKPDNIPVRPRTGGLVHAFPGVVHMSHNGRSYFHLHLISDATGETLNAVAKAVTVQYRTVIPVEHVYPLVRNRKQLDRVLQAIENEPGIVLFTLVDSHLRRNLEESCMKLGMPSVAVLDPVHAAVKSYLGAEWSPLVGAQHVLDTEYFERIEALNYTMLHDDGQIPQSLETADVVLVGVSRTSKTPTSIYLANRGIKTANIPFVNGIPLPAELDNLSHPLVVGLIASPERIIQIRRNRLLALNADSNTDYVDKQAVSEELTAAKRLFARRQWPVIDVTRRSIEETAAAIMDLRRSKTAG
jgi:regulator of PEP synthase PpsR (kinase-PPPase family)